MVKKFSTLALFILAQSLNSFAQTSTVYFYRLKSLYLANTECIIAVNDTTKFTIGNGSYYALKTNVESINIISSMNNSGIKNLKLEKGKTYYIRADLQTPNSVILTLENEFTGMPAIERLQADEKAKQINSANLKVVKVMSVAPLPVAGEGLATIYLFRPFNVAGVSFTIKVSDGELIYDMKNNSSYTISTVKDEITLITANEGSNTSNTSLKLKLEKGKVYYVAVLRTGGALVLSETKEDYTKREMKLK